MATRQQLQGNWNQVKGQIRERWGEVSDQDLERVKGDASQLIGLIQQRTGTARREIEDFIDQMVGEGRQTAQQFADRSRRFAEHATEAARERYGQMSDQMELRFREAEDAIRSRPMQAVGIALGAGLVAGIVASLLMQPGRSRR